ncbi:MAG: hypothetical protein ACKVZ6_09300 [Kineosporiaceae bacterium]
MSEQTVAGPDAPDGSDPVPTGGSGQPAGPVRQDEPDSAGSGPARPEGAVAVRLRRAPKYRAFVVTGALVGVLLGVVAAVLVGVPTQDESFALGTLIRYFAAILGLLGAVVGAAAALLAERRRG